MDGATSNWVLPRRTRRRTAKACTPCRIRKSGCDGGRPFCSLCKVKGSTENCVYQTPLNREPKAPSTMYDGTVDISNGYGNAPVCSAIQGTPQHQQPSDDARSCGLDEPMAKPIGVTLGPNLTSTRNADGHTGENITSENLSPGPSRNQMETGQTMFGPSSTHSFILKVATIVQYCTKSPGTSEQPPLGENSIPDAIGFSVHRDQEKIYDVDAGSLPERQVADSLLEDYWRFSHAIFPVLHRPTFMAQYREFWKSFPKRLSYPPSSNRDLLLSATVEMVLAVGCQRCQNLAAERRQRDAESLYTRSVRLIPIESLDVYSIEIVQLLLLRTIYLQYTPHATRCWSTLGVALRAAQAINLHAFEPTSNQLEREMRRRLWYTILAMDWSV